MKKSAIVVLCLFGVGLLTACQQTATITVDDLYGVWVEGLGVRYLILDEDGTYYLTPGATRVNPYEFGQFRLDGTTIAMEADKNSENCATYGHTYEVELVDENGLVFFEKEIECPLATGPLGAGVRRPPDAVGWSRFEP